MGLLDRMKQQTHAQYINPYTRNRWPLNDLTKLKKVLKLVPVDKKVDNNATLLTRASSTNTRTSPTGITSPTGRVLPGRASPGRASPGRASPIRTRASTRRNTISR